MQTVCLPYDGNVKMYSPAEGVGLIARLCRKAPFSYKGKGENRKKYFDVVMTYDIETTKLINENWNKKMAEAYHYFNYTFCWQVMIEDCFIFGREAEEFFEMLREVSELLDGTIIVWIHNSSFEVNNLADYFYGADMEKAFFRNKSTPLFIDWKRFQFRCSAQLTHKSLAMLGDDIGIEKLKEDFDYTRTISPQDALSPMDINYCYRDVKIPYEWLKRETREYCKSIGKEENPCWLPYTQTGYVRKDMRKNFSDTAAGHYILTHTALTQQQYELIRPAFFGGYVHANFRIIGDVIRDKFLHVDITSAYPWAMCSGKFIWKLTRSTSYDVRLYLDNLKREDYGQIGDFDLVDVELKKGHVPYIPYIEGNTKVIGKNVVEENGKVIIADYIRITCCDIDMRLILANYKIKRMRINRLYVGTKRPLPYAVVDTVLQYYEKKTALKGLHSEDGSIEYQYGLNKQKQNSCYGMAAQDLMLQEFTVDPETLEAKLSEEYYEEAKTLPYQWALQITAMVRAVTYGFITWLTQHPEDGNIAYYSDTDSVFCRDTPSARKYIEDYNKKIIAEQEQLRLKYFNAIPKNVKGVEKPLGVLAMEEDCLDAIEFCTIGAKRYYVRHADGTVDITFSGLRATKTWYDKDHIRHNGRNTQRLIDKYGSVGKAFQKIKTSDVFLPYEEGTDKLSNYNVRGDFVNRSAFGYEVHRPCTYTLYGMSSRLSLNVSLSDFLGSEIYTEVE